MALGRANCEVELFEFDSDDDDAPSTPMHGDDSRDSNDEECVWGELLGPSVWANADDDDADADEEDNVDER